MSNPQLFADGTSMFAVVNGRSATANKVNEY